MTLDVFIEGGDVSCTFDPGSQRSLIMCGENMWIGVSLGRYVHPSIRFL